MEPSLVVLQNSGSLWHWRFGTYQMPTHLSTGLGRLWRLSFWATCRFANLLAERRRSSLDFDLGPCCWASHSACVTAQGPVDESPMMPCKLKDIGQSTVGLICREVTCPSPMSHACLQYIHTAACTSFYSAVNFQAVRQAFQDGKKRKAAPSSDLRRYLCH